MGCDIDGIVPKRSTFVGQNVCPTCGGRGWHTAGGNDPMACGRCSTGAAFAADRSEYQYRLRTDQPMPDDWDLVWEDDLGVVEEEAEVARAIGFTGVRIETRLRPAGTGGEWVVSW